MNLRNDVAVLLEHAVHTAFDVLNAITIVDAPTFALRFCDGITDRLFPLRRETRSELDAVQLSVRSGI